MKGAATVDGSEIPARQPPNMYETPGTYWEKTTISTGKLYWISEPSTSILKPTLWSSPRLETKAKPHELDHGIDQNPGYLSLYTGFY